MLAYIRTDAKENPEVVVDLQNRLTAQGIKPIITRLPWQSIPAAEPFLYYRNSYLRYPREAELLKFHQEHDFLFLRTTDEEVISVKPQARSQAYFIANCRSAHYCPKLSPLPLMVGLHQRLEYSKLTLNALLHSLGGESQQKIYLLLSQPNPGIRAWVIDEVLPKNPQIEAVVCEENLGFSLFKWGSRYWGLKSFIHWEDDGILPEATRYLLPYWTRQIAYRATTADFTGFRVSEENQNSWLHRQRLYRTNSTYLSFDPETIWNYFISQPTDLPPISGNGLVIEANRDYQEIGHTSDLALYRKARSVCLANIPVYHIGANHAMDYGEKPRAPLIAQKGYSGINLRTGEIRVVHL